jgi:hypothetical protein
MSPRGSCGCEFQWNHFAAGAMRGRLRASSAAGAGDAAMRTPAKRATAMRQALLLGVALSLFPLAGAYADTLQDAFAKA